MVDHVRATWQVSIRRACGALPVERSTYHYRSRRTGQAHLIKRIKHASRNSCGIRRDANALRLSLGRQVIACNHRKAADPCVA